jgi:hypothetical protein
VKQSQSKVCETVFSEINAVSDRADARRIEQVASDLERIQYEPIFLIPVEGFLRMTKEQVLEEVRRTCDLTDEQIASHEFQHREDPEKIRSEQLLMLKRNFHLLVRLRADEPEAWDEIHELYEDD